MTDVFVATSCDLREGERKIVEHGVHEIGVVRANGRLHAFRNVCPHQGGPVCEGALIPPCRGNHRRRQNLSRDGVKDAGAKLDGEAFPNELLQDIFGAAIKLYAQKFEQGRRIPPVVIDEELSATTMLLTVAMLLKAANLELFELGMWQTFSGVR